MNERPKPTEWGATLRLRRRDLHLSQRTLGDLVGLSFTSICWYESGYRSPRPAARARIDAALDALAQS
jgi:transcriptional regulator with XRE-family HTH domain